MSRFFRGIGSLAAVLSLLCTPAWAQGTIQQSGPVTQFHVPAWFGNGVVADGGTPSTPFLSALGLFNGSNCPFGVSSQTGPGVATSPYALFTICQTLTATTFSFQGLGGAGAPNVYFNIGGTIYPFVGSIVPAAPLMQASQSITGPALVNVSTTFKIAPANASAGLPANGFITQSVGSGSAVPVYFSGLVSGFTGLSGGPVFVSSTTPGAASSSPPASGSGNYAQLVGVAVSSTSIIFNPGLMNGPL